MWGEVEGTKNTVGEATNYMNVNILPVRDGWFRTRTSKGVAGWQRMSLSERTVAR